MEEKKTNAFDQLVEDLLSGKLSLTLVSIAIKTYIRRANHLPEETKDILVGSDKRVGVIEIYLNMLPQIIGVVDLAFKRGTSKNDAN